MKLTKDGAPPQWQNSKLISVTMLLHIPDIMWTFAPIYILWTFVTILEQELINLGTQWFSVLSSAQRGKSP